MEKYVKLQKIGQGSFGSAYIVMKKHDPTQQKLVMKEILVDPRDQQSALREAKLLNALDHPNIICCKESFVVAQARSQLLCIITEYATGGDLRKHLTAQQTRKTMYLETEILNFLVQILLALKHLHDRKIIHRDIKPENIFLMNSTPPIVKLGDFGVAKVLTYTLQQAQTMTGTPYYTSPEICMGKAYNAKTDVWSLGCLLYELMTFSHAFDGRNQKQLFTNIVNASFTPIETKTRAYSTRLCALVNQMLLKNPRERPSVYQIIQKPVLMERIQAFLADHALQEELNHTVLHGHHIFQRKEQVRAPEVVQKKSPAPAVKTPTPVRASPITKLPVKAPVKKNLLKTKTMLKNKTPVKKVAVQKQFDNMKAARQARANAFVADKKKKKQPEKQEIKDKIAAFNRDWQAQRQQLMKNLPPPPPPSSKPKAKPSPSPPPVVSKPSAPASKPKVNYPSPVVMAPPPSEMPPPAPAAVPKKKKSAEDSNKRLAFREKLREYKKQHAHKPSPLEDPIILVQNLPAYDESSKPNPPQKKNLEYEKMVLQLKSVLEAPPTEEEEEEEEEEEQVMPPLLPVHEEAPPPYDAMAPLTQLPVAVLEEERFQQTLRQLLQTTEQEEENVETIASDHKPLLLWMRNYIHKITTT